MSGAIPPLSQYTFMAWCLVKAQGQLYLYFSLTQHLNTGAPNSDDIPFSKYACAPGS